MTSVSYARESTIEEKISTESNIDKNSVTSTGFQMHLEEKSGIEQPDEVNDLNESINSTNLYLEANTASPWSKKLTDMARSMLDGQVNLGNMLERVHSEQHLSSQELLALQAGVYQVSQELELTTKLVEKGISTIKQTMNTQL